MQGGNLSDGRTRRSRTQTRCRQRTNAVETYSVKKKKSARARKNVSLCKSIEWKKGKERKRKSVTITSSQIWGQMFLQVAPRYMHNLSNRILPYVSSCPTIATSQSNPSRDI